MTYKKLINDVTDRFKEEQLIPKETAKTMKRKDPQTPKCHVLTKTYKTSNAWRSDVNWLGCHSTVISKFVEYHLQPTVKIYLLKCKIQMTFWIRPIPQKSFQLQAWMGINWHSYGTWHTNFTCLPFDVQLIPHSIECF